MVNRVKAIISKRQLIFIPDLSTNSFNRSLNRENEFDVIVVNESDRFASFHVELHAIGIETKPDFEWYKVDPELCAKKPPGDRTQFHVIVTKAPIPNYQATLDLKVKIFSAEFSDLYTEEQLSLTIDKPRRSLKLYLPIKEFKVFPGDLVQIPVLIYNLSPKATTVTVKISGLEETWTNQGNSLTLQIKPGDSKEDYFICQPPENLQALSQVYDFIVEAKPDNSGYIPPVQRGNLEILPQGEVKLSCAAEQQTIPVKKKWFPGHKANFATYEIQIENKSNLLQQIDLKISDEDCKKCGLEPPEAIELDPSEVDSTYLVARKKRPWLGGERRLFFKVLPTLSHPHYSPEELSVRIRPNPSILPLELKIRPRIPLFLQLAWLLLTLLLLWLLWLLNPVSHEGPVNSVRIIGNGGTVVSGSSDQTIRRWQISSRPWNILTNRLEYEGVIAENTGKAVRVIRPSPKDEDAIAAGLDNGNISFWNILSRVQKSISQSNDRVFDLDFTQDSHYLFSVHGSGFIYQWSLLTQNPTLAQKAYPKFAMSALALSEKQNEPTLAIIAGRYGKLAIWDWKAENFYEMNYKLTAENTFEQFGGQNHYIESLAISNRKHLLVMADNKGYITLWNMEKVRQCLYDYTQTDKNKQKNVSSSGQVIAPKILNCDSAILDQWQDGHSKQPVRSVALTNNGCYLASTGDDGRVMLWAIAREGKRVFQEKQGKLLARYPDTQLNTVDIETLGDRILIASDAKNYRVSLYRVKRMDVNASCYQ